MSRRKTIGPIYQSYPARTIGEWLGDKSFKIGVTIVSLIVWTGIYYVGVSVVNFNKNNFLEGATETTTKELFRTEASLITLAVSSLFIAIYIFRSKIGASPTKQKKRR